MHRLLNIILFLSPLTLLAQSVTFKATAPREVQVGQRFSIQYTVTADKYADDIILPDFKNMTVITTSKGTGSNISITISNGKKKSISSFTTSWNVYLQADKISQVKIPAATTTVNGKKYYSNSINISIVKSTSNQNNQPNVNQTQQEVFNEPEINNESLFLTTKLNKSEVYQGEPILLTTRVFVSPKFQISLEDFKLPDFNKFWSKEVKLTKSPRLEDVIFNNKKYLSTIMDQRLLFPQTYGKIDIEPHYAVFSMFDSWRFPVGTKKVFSQKKTITVKPLPVGKPNDFAGAVGNFIMTSKIDKKDIDVNEDFSVTLKIKGVGNFGIFDLPIVDLPDIFEKFNPEENDSLFVEENGITGAKTIKYSFIARKPGNYTINSIRFSYFDPSDENYHTLETDTFNIVVKGDTAIVNNGYVTDTENEEIIKDIRFIKTNNLKLKQKNNFLFESNLNLLLVYLSISLVFFILIFFFRKKIKENADIRTLKYKQADKVSRKRLKKAKAFMLQANGEEFYQEILKAMWGYVSDKLNIEQFKLTRDNVYETFQRHEIPEELQNKFIKLLDRAETSRYAPEELKEDMSIIMNDATELINNFEKLIIKR